MEIDRSELLRYLRWKGQEIDDYTQKLIDEAVNLCQKVATPRHTLRLLDYDGTTLVGTGFTPEGKDIAAHLKGCTKVYLFAATVGAAIEQQEKALFARSSALGLIFDAAASCAIESYCDDVCADLAAKSDLPLTPRFSCGYGDFPLSAQLPICTLLDTPRRIGVFTDEKGLLIPRKSVTALIGVGASDKVFNRCISKCDMCRNLNCAFRKS